MNTPQDPHTQTEYKLPAQFNGSTLKENKYIHHNPEPDLTQPISAALSIDYRLSPSPLILPRSNRSYSLALLYSAISSSDRPNSVATCARYHNTSPSSALSASRISALICPFLSRNTFLI